MLRTGGIVLTLVATLGASGVVVGCRQRDGGADEANRGFRPRVPDRGDGEDGTVGGPPSGYLPPALLYKKPNLKVLTRKIGEKYNAASVSCRMKFDPSSPINDGTCRVRQTPAGPAREVSAAAFCPKKSSPGNCRYTF